MKPDLSWRRPTRACRFVTVQRDGPILPMDDDTHPVAKIVVVVGLAASVLVWWL